MRSSSGVILNFSALFLGIWLIFIADGLLVSSTAVVLKAHSWLATGLITACMFAGALFCALFAPKFIARFGFVRSYALFSALFALCVLGHIFSDSLFVWGALRVGVGFCYYSIVLVAESWLNARAISSFRSRILSFYEIVFYVGFGVGTAIMGLNLEIFWLFLITTICIILGQIPLNLTSLRSPPLPKQAPKALPRVFDLAPLALFTSICAGLLMNGFFTMASAYAISAGKTPAQASIFIICGMLGGCLAHTICGSLSDKLGRKFAILVFDLLAIAASMMLLFEAFFYLSAVILGAGICVLYSLALARANDVVKDKSECVNVSRTLLFSYLIGSSLSPVFIGGGLALFGSVGYGVFCLLVSVALFVFALFQRSVLPAQREKFEHQNGVSIVFKKEGEC